MEYNQFKLFNDPWFHAYTDCFINENLANTISKNFPKYDDRIWNDFGKTFDTKHGIKKELTNKLVMHQSISEFITLLESKGFVKYIENITGIKNLFVDNDLYGGGLNLYPPEGFLQTHIDFNFNNDISAYRTVNLIYYLNDDYEVGCGGEFTLNNGPKKLVKSIRPILNSCLLFVTNNETFHGVNKTRKDFYRKSISIWYYTKNNQKNVDKEAHKTIWI